MRATTRLVALTRSRVRALSEGSRTDSIPAQQIAVLESKLSMGLEYYNTIAESSEQLMLETDPSARKPREFYLDRYRNFALGQVASGLQYYQHLKQVHGTGAAEQSLKGTGLRTLLAECLLARDKLESQIAATKAQESVT